MSDGTGRRTPGIYAGEYVRERLSTSSRSPQSPNYQPPQERVPQERGRERATRRHNLAVHPLPCSQEDCLSIEPGLMYRTPIWRPPPAASPSHSDRVPVPAVLSHDPEDRESRGEYGLNTGMNTGANTD